MNSSNVGARRGAVKEGANVPRHRYSALPFATVVVVLSELIINAYVFVSYFFLVAIML